MKCENCGMVNPEDYKYCQECGEELVEYLVCPECKHPNQPDFKFCMKCGNALQISTADPVPSETKPPKSLQRTQTQVQTLNQTSSGQPAVVIIQEPQQRTTGSNLLKFILRFAGSLVAGYVLGEFWMRFFSGY